MILVIRLPVPHMAADIPDDQLRFLKGVGKQAEGNGIPLIVFRPEPLFLAPAIVADHLICRV